MRGRPGRVCPPHGHRLHPPDPRHHALLPRVCSQGGAGDDTLMQILDDLLLIDNNIVTGIRESCHVPTGTAAIWRGEGAGRVLHHPMCRHRGDRGHEGPGVQCPAPGGAL